MAGGYEMCFSSFIKFITHHWGKIILRERRLLGRERERERERAGAESRHDDVPSLQSPPSPGQTYKYHSTYHAAPARAIGEIRAQSAVRTKSTTSPPQQIIQSDVFLIGK